MDATSSIASARATLAKDGPADDAAAAAEGAAEEDATDAAAAPDAAIACTESGAGGTEDFSVMGAIVAGIRVPCRTPM
ncbi:hypothetical protein CDN98_11130 [Roseateles terrae]|nr:hypothetical protein CDN98_11130 [Roseateles terrae]